MVKKSIEKLRKGADLLEELEEVEEIIESIRKRELLKIWCGTGIYIGGHRDCNHRLELNDVMQNDMRAEILGIFNRYANVLRLKITEL
ncbi:hypothetical protein [uncultured Megasphaera sp.]|uniref:hypothetical protein n=1 Tax=uncultured Megasphaera sp. TaxID=165188 RepID=UPI0025EDFD43|nr:hypothetical protein [uncultured Megasphaera sp.]